MTQISATNSTPDGQPSGGSSTGQDPKRTCPHCAGHDAKRLDTYSTPDWHIVKCSACDFVYLANPVSYDALVEDHAWEKNFLKENERRRTEKPVLDTLSKNTRLRLRLFRKDRLKLFRTIFREGRIVDVGCGGGSSLPEPLIPYGIEISKGLAKLADQSMRERGGKCIHASALDGLKECDAGYFDGVLLNSFLEHETNPAPLLQEAHRVLKDDGVIYVRVPNFASINRKVMGPKWCGFRYPDHVNYFTPASFKKMYEAAGFKGRLINGLTIQFDDNIKAVLSKA